MTIAWKRKEVTLEEETETDRQVSILLRLKPGERFVVPHRCEPEKEICAPRTQWHRSAQLAKVKIRTAHDDVGRLLVFLKEPTDSYGQQRPYREA